VSVVRPRRRSTTERELVGAVRAELAAIEPTRRCCQIAERAGLGQAALGRARSPQVGRLAVRLTPAGATPAFEWSAAAAHCRVAWLRGLVLARGSLSIGASGTHLELVVLEASLGEIVARLDELGLAFGVRSRRGRGVITWKHSEAVLDLLRLVGVSTAALEIESRLVGRALQGHLNRVVNAENANMSRALAAALRQLADIDELERTGGLRRLPTRVRRVAAARQRAPEATLAELAATVQLSRAQVQRALQMIGSAALHRADVA
jgi:DNA-binding transcriptional regulator WhiA